MTSRGRANQTAPFPPLPGPLYNSFPDKEKKSEAHFEKWRPDNYRRKRKPATIAKMAMRKGGAGYFHRKLGFLTGHQIWRWGGGGGRPQWPPSPRYFTYKTQSCVRRTNVNNLSGENFSAVTAGANFSLAKVADDARENVEIRLESNNSNGGLS